ncbi:hypothetical protein VTL71DRAFT_11221 [Oculimacula yallundae]|uniref:Uncharacterized protein n=1 Tax=Oculimacula yallundae TaxID=86028 RepID=A0ABR4CVB9_9HELO
MRLSTVLPAFFLALATAAPSGQSTNHPLVLQMPLCGGVCTSDENCGQGCKCFIEGNTCYVPSNGINEHVIPQTNRLPFETQEFCSGSCEHFTDCHWRCTCSWRKECGPEGESRLVEKVETIKVGIKMK